MAKKIKIKIKRLQECYTRNKGAKLMLNPKE